MQYRDHNRALWNAWTEFHQDSPYYDLRGFRAGGTTLRPIEIEELGDVRHKSLLHLMCHFGLDTLSWARRGACVTGVDLSDRSIALARALSEELDLPATFACCAVEEVSEVVHETFDIVFTSYGVLHWLPDLRLWARSIAASLNPGGVFYIVEKHPMMRIFDASSGELRVTEPYFFHAEPHRFEAQGSYASPVMDGRTHHGYIWDHSLGEILTAVAGSGLRIDYVHEFPYGPRPFYPWMEQGPDGMWHPRAGAPVIPLLFSLHATKRP